MANKDYNLHEFLFECDLQHYFREMKNTLKINKISQLKYATDDDLLQLGLTKPELRRLRKLYAKKFNKTYFSKLKRLWGGRDESSTTTTTTKTSYTVTANSISNQNYYNLSCAGSDLTGNFADSDGDGDVDDNDDTDNGNGNGNDDADDNSTFTLVDPKSETVVRNYRPDPKLGSRKHIISPDSISINKELGSGEFGIVQQGVWTNNGQRIQVAIKCLLRERMQTNPIDFLKEAAIMYKIDHKHIVQMYGVVLEGSNMMLVTELAPLRSLLECLQEPALRESFPVITLCDFAIQICDGMQYLEMNRLVHRDLAARNILVFAKDKVKISDFGLTRALGQGKNYYQTNINVHLKLPIAWCSPESIAYLRFTSASDVWAYAVTLWEMFTYGFCPWAALTGQQIFEAIDAPKCQRLFQPDCCPNDYYALMLRCWSHDPNDRPTFSELFRTALHDCKPERVMSTANSDPTMVSPKFLTLRSGDIITVLDKVNNEPYWKGVLNNGKCGLFNPSNIVTYLGSDLPNPNPKPFSPFSPTTSTARSKSLSGTIGRDTATTTSSLAAASSILRSSGRFLRNDFKFSSTTRKHIDRGMIGPPQDDLKHTGHVGLDGCNFGDISLLVSTQGPSTIVPKQIVAPYKPQNDTVLELKKTSSPPETVKATDQRLETVPETCSSETAPTAKAPLQPPSRPPVRLPAKPPVKPPAPAPRDNQSSWKVGSENFIMVTPLHFYQDIEEPSRTDSCKPMLYENDAVSALQKREFDRNTDDRNRNVTNSRQNVTVASTSPTTQSEQRISPDEQSVLECFDFGPSLLSEMESAFRSLKSKSSKKTSQPLPSPMTPTFPAPSSSLPQPLSPSTTSSEAPASSSISAPVKATASSSTATRSDDHKGKSKRQANVKPISATDQKSLDSAIALATAFGQQSMESKSCSLQEQNVPKSLKDLRDMKCQSVRNQRPKRNFRCLFSHVVMATFSGFGGRESPGFLELFPPAQDIQGTFTEEGKIAYEMLIDKNEPPKNIFETFKSLGPETSHRKFDSETVTLFEGNNPLKIIRSGTVPISRPRTQSTNVPLSDSLSGKRSLSPSAPPIPPKLSESRTTSDPDPVFRPGRRHALFTAASVTVQRTLQQQLANTGSTESIAEQPQDQQLREQSVRQQRHDESLEFEASIEQELDILEHLMTDDVETKNDIGDENVGVATVAETTSTTTAITDPTLATTSASMTVTAGAAAAATTGTRTINEAAEYDHGSDCVDSGGLLRHNTDNVSCEDLLEFADSKPSARQRGIDSDEVRIMSKVLSENHANKHEYLQVLEEAEWDVHKAIKIVKLKRLLAKTDRDDARSLDVLRRAIEFSHGDLSKAFDYLQCTDDDDDDDASVVHV